jgi:hypothetical protein
VIVFILAQECSCCEYRKYNYNEKWKVYKVYLDEEPVPNCNRERCLINNEDITRFINNGWVIKNRKEVKTTWQTQT